MISIKTKSKRKSFLKSIITVNIYILIPSHTHSDRSYFQTGTTNCILIIDGQLLKLIIPLRIQVFNVYIFLIVMLPPTSTLSFLFLVILPKTFRKDHFIILFLFIYHKWTIFSIRNCNMALTKQLSAAADKAECLYKELIDAIVS